MLGLLGADKHVLQVLPNQTWVRLPVCSKANLLTAGCGEGKSRFIAGTKQGVQVATAQKA